MVSVKKQFVMNLGDAIELVKNLSAEGYNGFLIAQLAPTVWEVRAWKRKA
jgi:hypothetical protein